MERKSKQEIKQAIKVIQKKRGKSKCKHLHWSVMKIIDVLALEGKYVTRTCIYCGRHEVAELIWKVQFEGRDE